MIDESVFHDVLVKYKDFLITEEWGKQELYKWEAISVFQKNWNGEAVNMADMLKRSLGKTENLLDKRNSLPNAMIQRMAEWAPDAIRSMFKDLYDESVDVCERIEAFKQSAWTVFQRYNHGENNHYQDEHAISVYLWLRFPDKYYIYQFGIVKNVATRLNTGLVFKKGAYETNISKFYSLYDELNSLIKNDDELRSLLNQHILGKKQYYSDPELITLTIDLGHYIGRYLEDTDFVKIDNEPTDSQDDGLLHDVVREEKDNTTPQSRNYWWLVAKPSIWSLYGMAVDEVQSYTLYNENNHQRRIFKNFLNAKKGDLVIGYEATPTKQIVALLEIAEENNGKELFFKKTESLSAPVDFSSIKDIDELSEMEFLKNKNGSFFKLTEDEFNVLIDIIREDNPINKQYDVEKYDDKAFLDEVFMSKEDLNTLKKLLETKNNLILQGAPGTGKTFAATRLAYAIMGIKDKSRVEFIQFHQNYSYEDFIMGYKPEEDGGFKLQKGVFYNFCRKAKAEPNKHFFFIIDEINRGNLSKIFGELLLLIEKSYRGENVSVKLAYSDELFYVPKNLYIIGMMNTADRSLAMIDYALRRRFAFFKMKPSFDSEGFKKYQNNIDNRKFDKVIDAIKSLNENIMKDDSLGEGFCIGHSYFCEQKKYDEKWLHNVIMYDVAPMLEEYWFDNKETCEHEIEKLTKALDD